jgi:hypothetical protein
VVSSIAFSAPPPDLPALTFDGYGFCCSLPTRPRVLASYPVLVHWRTPLLHASFRPHLAMTPLGFANPSPPSGLDRGFAPHQLSNMQGTQRRLRLGSATRSHFPAPPRRLELSHRGLQRGSKDERTVTTACPQPAVANGPQRPTSLEGQVA